MFGWKVSGGPPQVKIHKMLLKRAGCAQIKFVNGYLGSTYGSVLCRLGGLLEYSGGSSGARHPSDTKYASRPRDDVVDTEDRRLELVDILAGCPVPVVGS